MKIQFFKYQGTGNDFVMIDDRKAQFDIHAQALIERLCHRRFGIGADGLILLRNHLDYDFEMVYFNSDGRQTSMCGNGGRCIVKFAHQLGVFKDKTTFLAIDGVHDAYLKNGLVHLKMNDVADIEAGKDYHYMNTGSPHYVKEVKEIEKAPLISIAHEIRYGKRFAEKGVNVNLIEEIGENTIYVRTYERGVEDETYSCGTGVTAACIAVHLTKGMKSPVQVKTKGGNLSVSFEKEANTFKNVFLVGAAEYVFEGFVEI
ncbi:MAG: diaminopimelate epimerase [Flammeovirgaceae bacterium]